MSKELIPLTLFICIAWTITAFVNRRSLHKERMNAIDKGANLTDLDIKTKRFESDNAFTLKIGLVSIGVSIGFLLGSFFEQNEVLANSHIGYYFSISLFTGIALVSSYLIQNKKGVN